jgi:hypothetical protein
MAASASASASSDRMKRIEQGLERLGAKVDALGADLRAVRAGVPSRNDRQPVHEVVTADGRRTLSLPKGGDKGSHRGRETPRAWRSSRVENAVPGCCGSPRSPASPRVRLFRAVQVLDPTSPRGLVREQPPAHPNPTYTNRRRTKVPMRSCAAQNPPLRNHFEGGPPPRHRRISRRGTPSVEPKNPHWCVIVSAPYRVTEDQPSPSCRFSACFAWPDLCAAE